MIYLINLENEDKNDKPREFFSLLYDNVDSDEDEDFAPGGDLSGTDFVSNFY